MRTSLGMSLCACMLSGSVAFGQGGVMFRGLGTLWPDQSSFVTGISPDGRVPVGFAMGYNDDGGTSRKPVMWPDGIVWLEGSPAYWDGSAQGASRDGSVIVGWGQIGLGGPGTSQRAFRATGAGVVEYLPGTTADEWTYAYAVTPDGSRIVGGAGNAAAVWSAGAASPPAVLAMPSGATWATAQGISADGGVIAGTFRHSEFLHAGVWGASGFVEAPLPPGERVNMGVELSLDGMTMVGAFADRGTGPGSFIWRVGTGVEMLTDRSVARCVSADGSVIGGSTGSLQAALWTDGERANVADLLAAAGVDLSGWSLTTVTAVSADGRTIAGTGSFRYGDEPREVRTEGWIAVIPGPGASGVVVMGLALRGRRR